MQEYGREHPIFALCGLNCGLCPRYHTEGVSRCPGCGGPDFHLKHPACGVIGCSKKHHQIEFCFLCSQYPCQRYEQNTRDSFISYRNVRSDFSQAKKSLSRYLKTLKDKMKILALLIRRYNDGKRKSFYCNAVNLLPLDGLKSVLRKIALDIDKPEVDVKSKAAIVSAAMEEFARSKGIALEMRK